MFEADNSRGILPSALRYFLQLLFFGPVIMLAGVLFSPLLSIVGLSGEHPSHTHFAGYDALVCLLVGLVVGWVLGKKVPSLAPVGRWIWVLPAVVVFPDMVRQGFSSRLIPWLPDYFFASGDNEGLGVFLLTLPTFSALGYSIGIALVGTRSRWEKLTGLSPISSVATITVAWVVLFSALALLAHGFERSRIDQWSRVRTVVDRPGLWLSTDGNQLCSARTSTAGPLLPTGTKVEGMERRVCFNSRLLDEDALAPAGSWSMERVKVLNGSNGKVEGWVPSYGLLETLKQ